MSSVTTSGGDVAPASVGLRRAMQDSIDPRARRTRQAILDAVRELAASGTSTTTVSDIVERAGISRSSFYAQFADIDDVAVELFRVAFADIESSDLAFRRARKVSRAKASRVAIYRLVAHMEDHRHFYRGAMPDTAVGHHQAVRSLAERLSRTIPEIADPPRGVSVPATALYLAAGTFAILRAWLLDELPGTRRSITDHLMTMLPAWLLED